jgi:hypothetical protein
MSPTARALAFVVTTFAAVNGLALAAGVKVGDTDLHPLAWFMTGRQGGDSWRPMLQAYDFAAAPEGRTRSLYEKLFFSPAVKHKGFQYPPTSLLAVAAADVFGEERRLLVLETVTWLFIPLTMAAVFLLLRSGQRAGSDVELRLLVALAIVATLAFYPALRAYRNGQAQTWINGLFAVGLLAFVGGRKGVAGALLGATCLIKPQYCMILLWGVLRREWRFAAFAAAIGGLGLLGSLVLFGVAPHLEYLSVLRFIADRGESFYPNQSVNGLMNRAVGNGLNLQWMEAMPEPHALVRAGTFATSALLLAWAFWPRQWPARAADLAMATLVATMASPIAWEHHYGVLLPIFALLLPALAANPVLGPRTMLVLAVAHLLSSHTWRITDRLADTPFNFVQAYILAGASIVLLLLQRLRRSGSELA